MPKNKPKYWYLTTTSYCPVCGRENQYKERIYDRPKPKDGADRYRFIERYDWCDAL